MQTIKMIFFPLKLRYFSTLKSIKIKTMKNQKIPLLPGLSKEVLFLGLLLMELTTDRVLETLELIVENLDSGELMSLCL